MRDSRGRGAGLGDLSLAGRLCFDRRSLLVAAAGLVVSPMARSGRAWALPDHAQRVLEESAFVYVSPLRGDGSESSCHAELWYGWLEDAVVVTVSRDSWKARALERGLSRARIWVGDYGRVKRLLGSNEAFRSGPRFEARAASVRDGALLERLLASFERKYPKEIDRWRERMRDGYRDGSRLLIRYTPV